MQGEASGSAVLVLPLPTPAGNGQGQAEPTSFPSLSVPQEEQRPQPNVVIVPGERSASTKLVLVSTLSVALARRCVAGKWTKRGHCSYPRGTVDGALRSTTAFGSPTFPTDSISTPVNA